MTSLFEEALADWNGELSPLASLLIPALDRAFLFGDAVYEVILVDDGRAWLLPEHLKRLTVSLRAVHIDFPTKLVAERIHRLLAARPGLHGYIYCQISRGAAKRTHVASPELSPNCLVYFEPLSAEASAARAATGVRVELLPDMRWQHCRIKSTSLLPNVLSQMEAQGRGCDEAVMYNSANFITEASRSNVFARLGETLVTPPLEENILAGVTRELVLSLCCELGLAVSEAPLARYDFEKADEAFLTGTLAGILPIIAINGKPLGEGRPGRQTIALLARYNERLARHRKD